MHREKVGIEWAIVHENDGLVDYKRQRTESGRPSKFRAQIRVPIDAGSICVPVDCGRRFWGEQCLMEPLPWQHPTKSSPKYSRAKPHNVALRTKTRALRTWLLAHRIDNAGGNRNSVETVVLQDFLWLTICRDTIQPQAVDAHRWF